MATDEREEGAALEEAVEGLKAAERERAAADRALREMLRALGLEGPESAKD